MAEDGPAVPPASVARPRTWHSPPTVEDNGRVTRVGWTQEEPSDIEQVVSMLLAERIRRLLRSPPLWQFLAAIATPAALVGSFPTWTGLHYDPHRQRRNATSSWIR